MNEQSDPCSWLAIRGFATWILIYSMVYYNDKRNSTVEKFYRTPTNTLTTPNTRKRNIRKIIAGLLLVIIISYAGFITIKANSTFNEISGSKSSILKSIFNFLPFGSYFLKNDPAIQDSPLADVSKTERINILLLGMRGENDEANGGMLTDSIMLISIKPKTNQIALVSIPRDIYIKFPDYGTYGKINEAYEKGELKKYSGGGIAYVEKVVGEITGLKIDYAVNVDFVAFKKIIDTLGGITIYLDKPFEDPIPLAEGKISLPAGKNTLDGSKALLYSRVRFSSSDFDRARRQQQVFIAIKEKAFTSGVLLNPFKISTILDILKTHIKTDMQLWEVEKLVELSQNFDNAKVTHKVLAIGEGGELIEGKSDIGAYILQPKNGDFTKIQEELKNIFDEETQEQTK